MKTLIITPTYNEKENIETVIDLVFKETSGLDLNILIVDDNSPDGTAQIVKSMMENKYKDKLFILQREGKQGLATAYIAGFKWGIQNNYDVMVEMDADLSHNPIYLKDMINMTEKYDAVVGSRNVKGGGVKGWGFLRNFISKGGSLYARTILWMPIKDLTGGYNVWTKKVLLAIGLDKLISRGYSFQIELKYRTKKLGFKIAEYPIIFEDRLKGKSKMSKKIFFEAMLNVWKLRFLNVRK
jgi:dolichol-phosphate mannosyltransferase